MKKWGIIILLLLVLAGLGAANLYVQALQPKRDAEHLAALKAQQTYDLEEVTDTYTYYGSETYYIVKAKNEKNEKVIVWVPKNKEKHDMIVRKENSGISRDKVISIVQKERSPEKIQSIRLGMENRLPMWEITYVDEKDSFTYYYIDFQTGEFLKRYSMYRTS
jgi:uncharacterized protein YpmB